MTNPKGIWKHANLFSHKITTKFQLSLGEGDTPLENYPSLPKALKVTNLYLKREDKNPNGSFKDRGLAYQISYYYQKGEKALVISSSGNAAISAAAYCKLAKIKLHIFVSNKIPKEKLVRLEQVVSCEMKVSPSAYRFEKDNFTVHLSDRPKSDAFKFAKKNKLVNLRGSVDPIAIEGFKTLGVEIAEQRTDGDAIFTPCSSGTSAVGIYEGIKSQNRKLPQIHVVQTEAIHPIVDRIKGSKGENSARKKDSIASAIVDRVAHRKEQVAKIVKESRGDGWIVSDKETKEAMEILEKEGVNVSPEGAMGLAALKKSTKLSKFKNVVCIVSGL